VSELFCIYPWDEYADYFEVCVEPDKESMHSAFAALTGKVAHPDGQACVCPIDDGSPRVGVVLFAADRIGVGIVAHEMAHAGFRALERRGYVVDHDVNDGQDSAEETYANVVERLNRQFWEAAYERKIAQPG
jgi:hypothetical protein